MLMGMFGYGDSSESILRTLLFLIPIGCFLAFMVLYPAYLLLAPIVKWACEISYGIYHLLRYRKLRTNDG